MSSSHIQLSFLIWRPRGPQMKVHGRQLVDWRVSSRKTDQSDCGSGKHSGGHCLPWASGPVILLIWEFLCQNVVRFCFKQAQINEDWETLLNALRLFLPNADLKRPWRPVREVRWPVIVEVSLWQASLPPRKRKLPDQSLPCFLQDMLHWA